MPTLTKTKDRPLDGRTPNMSISHSAYMRGLKKLRLQAKREHRQLITNDGVEDYRVSSTK